MADFPKFAFQRGEIIAFAAAGVSLADRGLLFGESVYEVLPITAGRVRLLEPHVARMRRGATALGLDVPACWTADAAWPHALAAAEGLHDGLLYVQLTGGSAPRAHLARAPSELFAYAMAHDFPDAMRRARGITAIVRPDPRWRGSDLKTTMLLPAILGKREAKSHGADEVLWVDADGAVLEGGSANVAIVEDARVVTPPPQPARLPGVSIAVVEELARELGVPFTYERIDRARLHAAHEVFVTATSQLVMPVVEIEARPVGPGIAGPVALRLGDALEAWMLRA